MRPVWDMMLEREWPAVQWRWIRISATQAIATKAQRRALEALQESQASWEEIHERQRKTGIVEYGREEKAAGLLEKKAEMTGVLADVAEDDAAIAWDALLQALSKAMVPTPSARTQVIAEAMAAARRP